MPAPDRLFHISDRGDIRRFEPHRAVTAATVDALVWAIDATHLPNYLLPRDCPRVTFAAAADSDPDDVARLLLDATRVVAIEAVWFDRVRRARLFCYHLPADDFRLHDVHAGYYVADAAVTPVIVAEIADPLAALLAHGAELRVLPSLWALRDAVATSTLQFSMIRMRNAQPRSDA
ncbi:MAG: hypothetical protein IT340_12140 [Chloroflexi bacterium]|nr:hypothetical protein [Chloroflexota bacterium]